MSPSLVDVRNLRKTFVTPREGSRTVLRDISFRIEPSERVAILGPSGSGKTTILRLIAGLEKPDGGEITIGTGAVPRPPRVVTMTQEANLFPWLSVGGNIDFPLEAEGMPKAKRRSLTTEALETVRMTNFKDLYPSEISGGMRQRTAFGRAIVTNPDVLLMDEPFGALDAMAREEIQEEFVRWWDSLRPTTILVTHSAEEAAFMADRVIVIAGDQHAPPKTITLAYRDDGGFDTHHLRAKEFRTSEEFLGWVADIRRLLWTP